MSASRPLFLRLCCKIGCISRLGSSASVIAVKGFVGVSEEMTPQGLVKVMNRYFSVMSAPIHEHGGIIDKYIGDAIMAYWGPPFTADAEQARLAGLAALDMLARVAPFRAELPDLLGLRNVPISFDIRVRAPYSSGGVAPKGMQRPKPRRLWSAHVC